jgi:guanine nucleotide exchange factor VAV
MNIKELGDVHTAFFDNLLACVKAASSSSNRPSENGRVGDVFLKFKENFLKYGDYCSGLTKAQYTLDTLCAQNKEVEKEVLA